MDEDLSAVEEPPARVLAPAGTPPGLPGPGLPPSVPTVPPPARRLPRPRWLPWIGLILLVGCLQALLRDAPAPGRLPAGGVRAGSPSFSGTTTGRGAVAVILDAGHGGADTGAVANGLAEKDLTLDLARRVAAVLERRGVSSRMTRTDDRYVPLATRARLGNAAPGAVFVSLHLNHADTGARGIETFYSGRKAPLGPPPVPLSAPARLWRWVLWMGGAETARDEGLPGEPGGSGGPVAGEEDGLALAQCIQTALIANMSAVDRGVKERSLYVTRHVHGAAVLVESGFLSNGAEARLLADPGYRDRLAESIAGAIVEYLQKVSKPRGATGNPRRASAEIRRPSVRPG